MAAGLGFASASAPIPPRGPASPCPRTRPQTGRMDFRSWIAAVQLDRCGRQAQFVADVGIPAFGRMSFDVPASGERGSPAGHVRFFFACMPCTTSRELATDCLIRSSKTHTSLLGCEPSGQGWLRHEMETIRLVGNTPLKVPGDRSAVTRNGPEVAPRLLVDAAIGCNPPITGCRHGMSTGDPQDSTHVVT